MSYLSQRLGLTRYEADEYYAMALEAYQKGQLDEAIDNIGFAITLLPNNSEYHAARGLFYLEDGVDDKARENFEQALKLHGGELLANYGMGVLSFRSKEWDTALTWFNRARTVNPTTPEIPYYIALVYHRQQDNATAKTYMEQAQQLMEDAGHKRRTSARRWVREFDKLVKEAAQEQPDEQPVQEELPIHSGGAGIRVSRQEIDRTQSAGALGEGDDSHTDNNDDDKKTDDKSGVVS